MTSVWSLRQERIKNMHRNGRLETSMSPCPQRKADAANRNVMAQTLVKQVILFESQGCMAVELDTRPRYKPSPVHQSHSVLCKREWDHIPFIIEKYWFHSHRYHHYHGCRGFLAAYTERTLVGRLEIRSNFVAEVRPPLAPMVAFPDPSHLYHRRRAAIA